MTSVGMGALAQPVPVKVLYILGTQRGGTTVAGRLLGQLPGFVFVGELRRLIQQGLPLGSCGCGHGYADCTIWSSVIHDVFEATTPTEARELQQTVAPDRDPALRTARGAGRAQLELATAAYCRVARDLYAALARATGARVVVDSSKSPRDAALLAHMADIDPFLLHLVRDPRATVFSRIVRASGPDGVAHPWQAFLGAGGWVRRHLSAGALGRAAPQRYLLVRYEDMVAEPNRFVEAVARLVGEPAPRTALVTAGRFDAAVAHTPTGRGRFGPISIHLLPDERWRSGLRPLDRMLVAGLCAPVAARYGYGGRVGRRCQARGGSWKPRSSR